MGPARPRRSWVHSHPGRPLQWPGDFSALGARFFCMWTHRWPRRTSCFMVTAAARPAAKLVSRSAKAAVSSAALRRPGQSSSLRRCERLHPRPRASRMGRSSGEADLHSAGRSASQGGRVVGARERVVPLAFGGNKFSSGAGLAGTPESSQVRTLCESTTSD